MEVNGHDSPSHHIIPRTTTFHTMRNNPSTRLTAIILFLMEVLTLHAQTTIQRGVTYRYNGKKPHTVIGGVYVKTATAAQGTVSDEKSGEFQLTLHNVSLGMPLGKAVISKEGMMVFNQQAVDEWDVRKVPLRVILCNKEHFIKQKQQLIAYGKRQAERKFERQKAELKRLNQANKIMKDAYYAKIDSLQKELDNAHQHIDEYADRFARIDESELDTIAQHAIDLFNQGETEAAIRTIERVDYLSRLDNAIAARDMAHQRRLQDERNEARADDDVTRNTRNIEARVDMYTLVGEWKKAAELLKALADKTGTMYAIAEYATFCNSQNQFAEAERYYAKEMEMMKDLAAKEPNAYVKPYAALLADLAYLYSKANRLDMSESTYKQAISILEQHSKDASDTNDALLANIITQLASIYNKTNRFEESESLFKKALDKCRKLAKKDAETYEYNLAAALVGCGNLSAHLRKYEESEMYYKESLDIVKRLLSGGKQEYANELAGIYYSLGGIYEKEVRFDESESMYRQSVKLRKQAAEKNPQKYEPALAMSLSGLGTNHLLTANDEEGEDALCQAWHIYERLATENPNAYEPHLASVLTALGLFYGQRNFSKAEPMLRQALEIRQKMMWCDRKAYEPLFAETSFTLANLYYNHGKYAQSEEYCKQAIETNERLAQENPDIYRPLLATELSLLAQICQKTQRNKEAEAACIRVIGIYEQLAKEAPNSYNRRLSDELMYLGHLYNNEQRYEEGEAALRKSINLFAILPKEDSNRFENSLALRLSLLEKALEKQGHTDESIKLKERETEIYERLAKANPDRYNESLAYSAYSLGTDYYNCKNYDRSEPLLSRAAAILKTLSNPKYGNAIALAASIHQTLAEIYLAQKHPDECEAMLKLAISEFEQTANDSNDGGNIDVVITRLLLSNLYATQNNTPKGYETNTLLIPEMRRLVAVGVFDKSEFAGILVNQSFFANLLGKFDEGEKLSLEALENDSTKYTALTNLAAAMLLQGRYEEAEKLYKIIKPTFKDALLDDLDALAKHGVIPKERESDVEKARTLLTEQ